MQIACSSPMVPGATLTEKAESLARWGYDAIAVFQPLDEWSDAVRRELATLERATGVRPVELVLTDAIYGKAMDADADLRARCRAMYLQAAEACAELGLVTEIEFEYGAQDPLPLFTPYARLDDEQTAEFLDFYRQMLDVVAGSDGRVLLEPLNRYESRYLNLVEHNLELVDAVDHPNAGLLPDTFHMSIEEADLPAALRLAADRIAHVHLGDSNRLLPGSGHLDWQGIFGALRDVGYDGTVNLECSTEGDPEVSLPAAADRIRALIGA
ncbi:sugar phosphate isomerase/epimerase [Agrococcus versicolor]|uniref:Sugar phosphate isomerase/epimerase n=1 Tax=Agrococcus versicolor TaxID=501482 RepID=A0ABP5MTG0_9MICO